MFPKWEFAVEDMPAENIIKLMFVKRPWKWTMDCWEVTGTWVNTKPTVVSPAKKKVVKEDSPRPRKKARKEAPAGLVKRHLQRLRILKPYSRT
ncbi:BnaCnng73970D [Brassica napus]|uniref:BnaCnng73970D protein n=1 Tax=Brassica napus TaxID=3708 RepID=A0A078JYC7_BRANA|nr:BnaCnng73970D [Brassica napus]